MRERMVCFGKTLLGISIINRGEQANEREAAIVNRNDKELIGSLKCVTTWCSKMPFFQK